MPDGKPNILVIWGDDIGISQPQLLQRRPDGLSHAQHRPHRQRGHAVHRLLRRAKLHCGPRRVHQWTKRVSHRHEQGRRARCRRRLGRRGPDDRRTAQAARLRDRPVRQEPLRRQEQAPADRARVRRVLRQPLSPQRRGGARAVRLPARRPVPEASRLRPAARRAEVQGHRRGVQGTRRSEVRPRRQADHRGHRPAGHQADGDHRRRHHRRVHRLHQAAARGGHAVLRVDEHHPHAPLHPHQAGEPRTGGAVAVGLPRLDDRPRPQRRPAARLPRRTRHRRGHHRRLQHRQRAAPQQLARRRHHAVPQREGHQLGGRVPGSRDDPLAREDRGGHGLQRDHPAPRLVAHVPGRSRRAGHHREAEEGP